MIDPAIEVVRRDARNARLADAEMLRSVERGYFADAALERTQRDLRWLYALTGLLEWAGHGGEA